MFTCLRTLIGTAWLAFALSTAWVSAFATWAIHHTSGATLEVKRMEVKTSRDAKTSVHEQHQADAEDDPQQQGGDDQSNQEHPG